MNLAGAEAMEKPSKVNWQQMTEAATNRATILLIDDDEQIRKLLIELLGADYECVTAGSAEEALAVLKTMSFAMVISDINMGGISGLDLVPQVHQAAPDTVVVMVSGQQSIDYAIEAMRAGAFDYMTKPLDLRHVDAAVQRALVHHQLLVGKRAYENDLEELVKRRTAEVKHMAYYDTLTGLPNRALFMDRLTQAVTVAMHSRQMVGALFLALDRFKKINDTLGHTIGDRLLQEAAERLKNCVSGGDTVARFDGDEFALLLTKVDSTEDLVEISRSINEVLKPSFMLEGQDVYVTASIGISLFPLDGGDTDTLLKNAGAALYRAKMQGGNNYQFYTSDMNDKAVKRLALESSLRHAIAHEEFVLYYQPVIDIPSMKVVGAEALLRWQHPELGLLAPGDFISLAEDTGLILPIGAWVLRTACTQTRLWQKAGFPEFRIAVNVSARQFQDEHLLEMVVQTLSETELESGCLELELTESSLMQNAESAVRTLQGLRTMGVKIAIDDFGTGYSSLGYLKLLPLDILKLDRSFVDGATSDLDDAAMVTAIITLAQNLRLKVIAEGIETQAHLDFLRSLGCDQGQGFFLGRPMPAEQFCSFVTDRSVTQAFDESRVPVTRANVLLDPVRN
jgi:diguanylate cyclase (GGDEF)-like protein